MPITDAFIATWDYSWQFDVDPAPTHGRVEPVLDDELDGASAFPDVWRPVERPIVERWDDALSA